MTQPKIGRIVVFVVERYTTLFRNYVISDERTIATVQAFRAVKSRTGQLSPSLEEIANELGTSISMTAYNVNRAIRKGFLVKTPGKYRSLRLTAKASTVPEPKKKGRAA